MTLRGARALVVVGCGPAGLSVAHAAQRAGAAVFGTTRRPERGAELAAVGVVPLIGEPDAFDASCVTTPFDVVYSVPPPEPAVAVQRAIARLAGAGARRLVYLSATSVFGVDDGRWVDDATPAHPLTESGLRRLAHEASVADACALAGLPFVSVRLPGIYGPGRTIAQRVLAGTYAVVDEGVMYSNRIYIDDIGPAVCAALGGAPDGARIIASDGVPFRVIEMARWVCDQLGAAPPRSVALEASPPQARDFWRGSRRCLPSTLLGLGWRPRVVDWRAGHRLAWAAEGLAVRG